VKKLTKLIFFTEIFKINYNKEEGEITDMGNKEFNKYMDMLLEAAADEIDFDDVNDELQPGDEDDAKVEDVDDVDDEDDDEDFDLSDEDVADEDNEEFGNVDDVRENRNKLMTAFNKINVDTYVELVAYEPDPAFIRSIRPKLKITDKMVYLDRDKYDKGTARLALSEIFYNDIKSIAAKLGLNVVWQDGEDGLYGVVDTIDE
jgi:hypothetical protein